MMSGCNYNEVWVNFCGNKIVHSLIILMVLNGTRYVIRKWITAYTNCANIIFVI